MSKTKIPTYDALMNPLIGALKSLGGSGTNDEISSKVAEIARLTDEQLEVIHDPEKSGRSEIEYRLAWARTCLKQYGVLDNSTRGIWSLTPLGNKLERVEPKDVVRAVRARMKRSREETSAELQVSDEDAWRDDVRAILLDMKPDGFERLVQRVLRESGFVQVEVTGRSGDGGIDGKGLLRLGGLLSFHVIFQCKRYQGTVGAAQVRDFRGAMVGRADKGLLITTGTFTKDAIREATRDGAPAIDLVDGEQLIEKLKSLGLGIVTRRVEVEETTVAPDWFANL